MRGYEAISKCANLVNVGDIITQKLENLTEKIMVLSPLEIKNKLANLPNWKTNGKEISHTYIFKDFVTAIDFVNRLVEPAENAGHHPDLSISYNKVTVNLTTHDQGGITEKDFNLAEKIVAIASNLASK